MLAEEEDVLARARRAILESCAPVDAERIDAAARSANDPLAAVRAMARATGDPHTMLWPVSVANGLRALSRGEPASFAGFAVHRAREGFVVSEVVPGGAADAAGVRVGDRVRAIDGEPLVRGMEEVLALVARSSSTIAIDDGTTTRELHLDLPKTRVPPLSYRRVGDVAVVRLRVVLSSDDPAFDPSVRVREALDGAAGLVLDLRSNPGGFGVTRFASALADGDPLLLYRHRSGEEEPARRVAARDPRTPKMVVLVNEQTNSAAEMIALVLRDLAAARLVGTSTAGGLTVPKLVRLDDAHDLWVPESIVLSARTRSALPGFRLDPDVRVENPSAEDLRDGRDAQLDAALSLLSRR